MNLKYNSFLFSELVYKYQKTNNEEIKNELYDRMMFCGFEKEMIKCFIELEILIINFRNIIIQKPFYKTYFWIKNMKNIYSSQYNDIFMINSDKVTKKTLLFSECISLLDEATYIKVLYKNIDNQIKEEIDYFSEINNKNIRKEIIYRFMKCYEKVYKIEMSDTYFKKVDRFINNELRIINLTKWIYPLNKQRETNINWKPYTSEYFNYYN